MKTWLAALVVGGLLLLGVFLWRDQSSASIAADAGATEVATSHDIEASLEADEIDESTRAPLAGESSASHAPAEKPSIPVGASQADPAHTTRVTLKARVVDEVGAPVANAQLEALRFEPLAVAESGPSGEINLTLDFAGKQLAYKPTIVLEVSAAGFARDRRTITVDVGAELWLEEWKLVASGSVAGRVLDESGRGVGGAQVACLSPSISEIEWNTKRSESLDELAAQGARAISGDDGSFVLEDVPHGKRRLVAVAEQWLAGATKPFELGVAQRLDGVDIRLTERVSGKSISGRVVRSDGSAVPWARIVVRSSGDSVELAAEANGRFTVTSLDRDRYEVTAFDPEGVLREAAATDVARGTRDLVLSLTEAPTVELVVVSLEGDPIEDFSASVRSAEGDLSLASYELGRHPDGILAVRVPGRAFVIDVLAPGWMPASLGPLSPASVVNRLEIRLSPAAGLSGTVLAGGSPVPGAEVSIHREVKRHTEFNGFPVRCKHSAEASAMSAHDGSFVVPVTSPGRYFVHVAAAGWARAELGPFELDSSSTRRESIELTRGGSMEVQVHSSKGRDVAGHVVALSRGDGWTRTSRCGTDGRLAFDLLTPGRWQVGFVEKEIDARFGMTRDGTKPPREIPWNCQVLEGQAAKIDLWIEDRGQEPCVLQGRLAIDGARAEGWQARLEEEDGVRTAASAFEPTGEFRVSVTQPGWYRLLLTSPMGNPSEMLVILDRVQIKVGNTEWSLELETGSLEGTLSAAMADPSKLMFHHWQRGTTQCLAPIAPGPDGTFRCARVSAGSGRIVKLDPKQPLAAQQPEVLAVVEIEAGKTAAVDVR